MLLGCAATDIDGELDGQEGVFGIVARLEWDDGSVRVQQHLTATARCLRGRVASVSTASRFAACWT